MSDGDEGLDGVDVLALHLRDRGVGRQQSEPANIQQNKCTMYAQ